MAHSDSENDLFDDVEDLEEEAEAYAEEDAAEDATEEGDDDSPSEDSEDASAEDEEEGSEQTVEISGDTLAEAFAAELATQLGSATSQPSQAQTAPSKAPSPPPLRKRSPSPAAIRRKALRLATGPRTFQVEAICALPHPVPTHALTASKCMTHLLTGSDDGYIRDYDIFTALNGKNFLTAPQRHHSGVVEGIMKAGQLRFWWENPSISLIPGEDDRSLSPVYSLEMQSDALWALAGNDTGHINLFTVRHEPGRLCHTFNGHRGPVSSMSLDHDEKSLFSAGWDGEAMQWDLNTGQRVRTFTSHGAQLMCIAVRPTNAVYSENGSPLVVQPEPETAPLQSSSEANAPPNMSIESSQMETDAKSDASFDPLFDDEPEDPPKSTIVNGSNPLQPVQRASASTKAPPKGAPPLLDHERYKTFSPDILMTVAIDGQIMLWDKRVNSPGAGVGRLSIHEKTPPWCLSAAWSADGNQIYAGRRNSTIEIYDVRQTGRANLGMGPKLLKTLRNPLSSRVVSCVVAFPDSKHIACASLDNIRLWNVAEAVESDLSGRMKSGVQFKIIPGHHGGYISQMLVDPGARFLVSASSNRATWQGDSTRTVFVHDIKHIR